VKRRERSVIGAVRQDRACKSVWVDNDWGVVYDGGMREREERLVWLVLSVFSLLPQSV